MPNRELDATRSSTPMTVVQLMPAMHSGGAERSTLEIASALVAAGHRSVVISAGGRLVEALEQGGSRHITLDIGRKSLGVFGKVRALRRLLREIKPDVVHARSRLPAWIGYLALRGLHPRPRFVTTVHGLNSPGFYSGIMLRGDRVIAVSQSVRDFVIKHYPDFDRSRLEVIPRGVDSAAFPYGYRPEDEWRERFFSEYPELDAFPLLTLPGRGTRLKGHDDAIELLAGLHSRGIEARLLLLGVIEPGREAYVAELRQRISVRGMDGKVVMTPPRDDVRDIFAVSSLILQLSNKPESFGRTVIEAVSLCRPVLGYAHGGVGELLAELYPAGRVPLGDKERLVERAAELLRLAPSIAPLDRYRLQDMQHDVLRLYGELREHVD
ncbi:glycosyltransferase [Oleiagrimonas soli]|uniref:Glycosyltransferase involved in cell wall biosynthesis n=2 Tax=Oleiagrimonas soli TaxID=1543381 RepID=A0A841KR41_9GAMM|nr:glycosyltransferase [Oleiagrimonas soli]MBB6185121.1 glycosyltransferase involved in cell wall biosynthesis [Oleiagrimonas soli]